MPTTGTAATFTEAYKTLSDPEKRAAYNVNLHSYRQIRWKLFDQHQSAVGKLAEKSKHRGITELLYTARTDNGRFSATAKGVDWAETEEATERMRVDHLLPAASDTRQPNI
jgi:curved DNA-binding protein CbpA